MLVGWENALIVIIYYSKKGGGPEEGKRGRTTKKKAIICGGSRKEGRGTDRIRLKSFTDVFANSLFPFDHGALAS